MLAGIFGVARDIYAHIKVWPNMAQTMSKCLPSTIFGNFNLTLPEDCVWPGGMQSMSLSES